MLSVQMSFRWTSRFKQHTISKYFELIVNWFLNLLVRNIDERKIKREKVQMKPPLGPIAKKKVLNLSSEQKFWISHPLQ